MMNHTYPLPTAHPASFWGADAARIAAREDEARRTADPRLEAEELAAAFARALLEVN